MEITVKEVSGPQQKSKQEVEEQLLKEQQEKQEAADAEAQAQKEKEAAEAAAEQDNSDEGGNGQEPKTLEEEDVLSFIREKYKKDVSSIDDLVADKGDKRDLPPIVEKYLEYKEETNGRPFEDFLKTQEDFDKKNPEALLRDYYSATEAELDPEDIDYLIEDRFGYDEEIDEKSEIKKKEISKKKELAKAKKYFNELKEKYKVPAESAKKAIPDNELEDYKAYKEYISKSQSDKQTSQQRSEYFKAKTDELFNDDFKGFEFKVGEQNIVFQPGDRDATKEAQSNIQNFIGKYLDKEGKIKDVAGYHKALSAALNPEKLANFFYEKGKSDAVSAGTRSTKNINMGVRSAPQQLSNKGFKIRAVDGSGSGRGLKIRSKKNS